MSLLLPYDLFGVVWCLCYVLCVVAVLLCCEAGVAVMSCCGLC